MGSRKPVFVLTVAATLLGGALSAGAEDVSLGNDVQATIALHSMACDHVVDVKRNGDSDYVATCKDGNRYHVFVSPEGRVVVEKL
jgi:hypothetical protein